MEKEIVDEVKEDRNESYTELIKSLNNLSKLVNDEKRIDSSVETQNRHFSNRSTQAESNRSSSSKIYSDGNHVMMCESLDNLVTHYLALYLSGTAEDKLMRTDLENVRSYFRRKINKKHEDMKRNQVNVPTARRFVMNGIRSNINPQISNQKIDDEDKPDGRKKLKRDQSEHNALPEIQKVIKNPHRSEKDVDNEDNDDDDDDDDLKVYDD